MKTKTLQTLTLNLAVMVEGMLRERFETKPEEPVQHWPRYFIALPLPLNSISSVWRFTDLQDVGEYMESSGSRWEVVELSIFDLNHVTNFFRELTPDEIKKLEL